MLVYPPQYELPF